MSSVRAYTTVVASDDGSLEARIMSVSPRFFTETDSALIENLDLRFERVVADLQSLEADLVWTGYAEMAVAERWRGDRDVAASALRAGHPRDRVRAGRRR